MNKRILELAEQARQYAWVNETHWSAGPERERLFEQKFAEKIVKECTDMLMLEHAEAKGQHNYYHVTANKLKKHFGVEE